MMRILRNALIAFVILVFGTSFQNAQSQNKLLDGPLIVAAITALQSALVTLVTDTLIGNTLDPSIRVQGQGFKTLIEQTAANTAGIQAAIQHESAVITEVGHQTAIFDLENKIIENYGGVGTTKIDGKTVGMDSRSPYLCKQRRSTEMIENADSKLPEFDDSAMTIATDYNKNGDTVNQERTLRSLDFNNDSILPSNSLSGNLTPDKQEDAAMMIVAITNPEPAPVTGDSPQSPQLKRYQKERQLHDEKMAIVQSVLLRQMNRAVTEDDEQSVNNALSEALTFRALDKSYADSLNAKLPKAVMVEIALQFSTYLYAQDELLRTNHEIAQLLALQVASLVKAEGKELKVKYGQVSTEYAPK